MKFALLGSSPEAVQLARIIRDNRQHELAAYYEVGEDAARLRELAPRVANDEDWEALLLATVTDAVIVSGRWDTDERADQLRKLVQSAVPLLVVHPACSVIVGFELDMIRRDTDGLLVPLVAGRHHPAVRRLRQLRATGELQSVVGDIEQVVGERFAPHRDRPTVLAALARDLGLVREFVGGVQRVGAMGPAQDDRAYANLNVQFSGSQETVGRWSIGPTRRQPTARLTLYGKLGKLVLDMPADQALWTLELAGQPVELPPWDGQQDLDTALAEFCRAVEAGATAGCWDAACQDLEIVSAVEQSVRRGRTIEIYGEEHSEEQTFKGLMAMGGCAILVLTLLYLVAAAIFEGLSMSWRDPLSSTADSDQPPQPRTHILIRLWPVYPFALFLLLQLLRLVFPSRRDSDKSSGSGSPG